MRDGHFTTDGSSTLVPARFPGKSHALRSLIPWAAHLGRRFLGTRRDRQIYRNQTGYQLRSAELVPFGSLRKGGKLADLAGSGEAFF